MLIIEVGATNVGSAVSTYVPGSDVSKGAEKGYFQFGGSLMICLFLPGKIELAEDLRMQSSRGLELYARMGDVMGHAKH